MKVDYFAGVSRVTVKGASALDFAERLQSALSGKDRYAAPVADAASGPAGVDPIDLGLDDRRRGARRIAVVVVGLAALFTAFAVARHRHVHASARPAASTTPPGYIPWELAVGPVRLDPPPQRPLDAPRVAPKRPGTTTRGERKRPNEMTREAVPRAPAVPSTPPDDLKVPRWRTPPRPEP